MCPPFRYILANARGSQALLSRDSYHRCCGAARVRRRSIAARQQPMGERGERCGPLPEGSQCIERLVMEQMHSLLRGFDADDRRMRGLRVLPVGAGGLAERRYIAQHVEKVVL